MYSQNKEEEIILNHFKNFKGTFLDLGAYDGVDLSNTRALTELGWSGVCIEPNPVIFERLCDNLKAFNKVIEYKFALGTENKTITMQMNDSYYSTVKQSEVDRWRGAFKFESAEVQMIDFKSFLEFSKYKTFDFISIDCEGLDYEILEQINLDEVKCKMVCVETNSKDINKYINYISKFAGFNVIDINAENLIMSRL
jgi:FkbM family methyltransferase